MVAANAIQSETIVVRVRLNTEDKGDVFVERTQDGDFLVKVADLKAMGFRDPQGPSIVVDGQPHLSLKAMQGVSFAFQEKGLTLSITADPALLPSRSLTMDGRRGRVRGEIPKGGSGFFNYALHGTANDSGAPSGATFSGELGWRLGDYLFLSDATTTQNAGHRHKFIRLMTSVTHDDREELRRTIFGDFFTPSRDFSTGVNLGGIGISKLYSLNPFFVQFPTQSVGGTVALPTDMEVYLNGQRIRNEKLQPGQFQLTDIAAYGGAQNVQVVLRDAFGRVQQLNYSFYFSDQPLRKGLHEYSYNAGAMRRSYGNRSNEYGPLAGTMFHRYGFSDALTLGVRAETARDFFNVGPIATVVLGDAGVLGGALAVSSTAGRAGGAGLLSYTYSTKKWSIGGSMRRDWRDYATLADPPTMTNRKVEANLSASYFLGEYGSISLSHSRLSVRAGIASASATPAQPFSVLAMGPRRATALSYSVPLMSGRASLSASLSHINDQASPGGRNEAFVGLIVFLSKDYSVAASHRGDGTTHNQSVQFTKNQPAGEGLGFILSGTRSTDPAGEALQGRSSVQYNAPAAVFRAELAHSRSQFGQTSSDYSVSAAGGIGFAGGTIGFGRPIIDSFGIVTVGRLPGIEVTVNGHSVGKTNARGQVFVPTLTPYVDNDVWIATDRIPIDYSIHSRLKTVSPSLRGGAVIEFPVTKLQAFSGHLKYRQGGTIKPAEFRAIRIEAEGRKLVFDTGRGGEFYIENLKPGTYPASVEIEGKACPFNLSIPASTETFVELGDVECRSAP